MIRYRFAERDGLVYDAQELREEDTPRGTFFACLGCEADMVPRFRGLKQQPHFAHRPGCETDCAPESYLHRLAKLKFLETFNACREHSLPFIAEIPQRTQCTRFRSLTSRVCDLPDGAFSVDLAHFFDSATLEASVQGFRADILLRSSNPVVPAVLVEFAVTHKCSPEKVASNARIIEVVIRNESDVVEFCTARRFASPGSTFMGFRVEPAEAPTDSCTCRDQEGWLFCVYRSGKSFLQTGTLEEVQCWFSTVRKSVIWTDFILLDNGIDLPYESEYFLACVRKASRERVAIRNCSLCRYVGENNDFVEGKPVFCKWQRKSVSTNDAASCVAFRKPRSDATN